MGVVQLRADLVQVPPSSFDGADGDAGNRWSREVPCQLHKRRGLRSVCGLRSDAFGQETPEQAMGEGIAFPGALAALSKSHDRGSCGHPQASSETGSRSQQGHRSDPGERTVVRTVLEPRLTYVRTRSQ